MKIITTRQVLLRKIEPYAWITPSAILFLIFLLYPIIFSFILSFFRWMGYSRDIFSDFLGFSNYIRLLKDPLYWLSLKNTIILVAVVVFIQNAIALFLSIIIFFGKFKFSNLIRGLLFFPGIVSSIVIGLVFRRILELEGLLNILLREIGLINLISPWLATEVLSIWIVSFVTVWQWVGYSMVIFYAGLQNIDNAILEAAFIDGASLQKAIFRVVIPMMKPVIFLSAIINFIGGFRIYDIIWVMTRGGPLHSSEVLTTYMYFQSFQSRGPSDMGYAATIAVTLAIIVIVFSALRMKFFTNKNQV